VDPRGTSATSRSGLTWGDQTVLFENPRPWQLMDSPSTHVGPKNGFERLYTCLIRNAKFLGSLVPFSRCLNVDVHPSHGKTGTTHLLIWEMPGIPQPFSAKDWNGPPQSKRLRGSWSRSEKRRSATETRVMCSSRGIHRNFTSAVAAFNCWLMITGSYTSQYIGDYHHYGKSLVTKQFFLDCSLENWQTQSSCQNYWENPWAKPLPCEISPGQSLCFKMIFGIFQVRFLDITNQEGLFSSRFFRRWIRN
jgi:hypothetical protein